MIGLLIHKYCSDKLLYMYVMLCYVCVWVHTMSYVSVLVCINGYVQCHNIRYVFYVSVYNVYVHSMLSQDYTIKLMHTAICYLPPHHWYN